VEALGLGLELGEDGWDGRVGPSICVGELGDVSFVEGFGGDYVGVDEGLEGACDRHGEMKKVG
jgi:hypothetical protein